ncbi:hypothetical protein [Pikeienuella sp. HZG-20]|uniref:hypothetical protein n=1 Tax=Paludibacillus litoralis TaxID=3133267 RepID=UPI0030EDB881
MIRAALLLALLASSAGAATAPERSGVWSRPGASPCAQADGRNPCWTAQNTPAAVLEARAAGLFTPDEICDGDVIANTYGHAGRAHHIPRQLVDFDRAWLAEAGLDWRRDAAGRSCIPSESYQGFHYVFACGNRVQLLERGGPGAATPPVGGSDVTRVGRHGPFLAATGEGRGRAVTPLPAFIRTAAPTPPAPVPAVPSPSPLWLLLSALGALLIVRMRG